VDKIMSIWTKKVGYPLVTITESDTGIHLQQNRFLSTWDVKPEEDETIYPIFIGLRTEDGVQDGILFDTRSMDIALKSLDFYKINTNYVGLFRTLYPSERLSKLGKAAKSGQLSVEDRIGLIADSGALTACGNMRTSVLLQLITDLSSETDFVVWSQILHRLSAIKSAWFHEPDNQTAALKWCMKQLVSPRAHVMGWTFEEGESSLLSEHKAEMFEVSGVNGDET
jgi:aminopeptidase 2